MDVQDSVDVLQFLSDDLRPALSPSYLEDEFSEVTSEPTSGFSSSPPSSPDSGVVPILDDSFLALKQEPTLSSPAEPVISTDIAMTESEIDYQAYLPFDDDDLDDDIGSAKRSRKRRKNNDEESIDVLPLANVPIPDPESGVMLAREHLLALSSATFEDYITRLQAVRDLTAEEKKEVKRQRRLIKNRESAQASRQRKKSYLDKLEQKVAAINSVNAQLREQLSAMQSSNRALAADNKSLKDQVAHLQSVIQKTPGLSSLIQSGTRLVTATQSDSHAVSRGSNARTAGVCLLVLLFSFGILFPQLQRGNSPFQAEVAHRSAGRVDKGDAYQLASSDTPLPDLLSEQSFNTRRISQQYGRLKDTPQQLEVVDPQSPRSAETSFYGSSSDDELPPRVFPAEAKRKRNEITSVHESATTYTQMSAIEVGGQDMLNATQVPRLDVPAITKWDKNTTYLLCDNIKHMTPIIDTSETRQQPTVITADTQDLSAKANESYVAFYIPPDGSTMTNEPELSHFMELKCKIIGVDMVPAIRKMGRVAFPSLPLVDVSA